MKKNVVILSASPRRNGNSDILCDEFMKGATEAGHDVEKIFFSRIKILNIVQVVVFAILHMNVCKR